MSWRIAGVGGVVLLACAACSWRQTDQTMTEASRSEVNPGGRMWIVDQSHAAASDRNDGTAAAPLATISKAAALAEPGDTVRVRAGRYREWVRPKRGGAEGAPIVYEAAAGETVILSGAEVWEPAWRPVPGHPAIFRAALGELAGGPFRDLSRPSRGGGTQGQLILDDAPLPESIDYEALLRTPGSWLSINGRELWLHWADGAHPPANGWQVSQRGRVFGGARRGLDYIHLRGLTFEYAGNQVSFPQVGAVSTRSGYGWVIEHCVIRYNKTIGIDCGKESPPSGRARLPNVPRDQDHDDWRAGGHLIRSNHIHDNGQCGIAGYVSPGTRVMHNRVERNGRLIPGFETGGIKFHYLYDGRVDGNLVIDNRGPGIWLDTGYAGAVVHRNVTIGNEVAGVMIELGHGPVEVTENIMLANEGAGFYSHDASDVTVARNLIANNGRFGVMFRLATDRGYGQNGQRIEQCEVSRNRVVHNTLIGNGEGEIGLPLDLPRQRDNRADHNLMVLPTDRPSRFELSGAPALRKMDAGARGEVLAQMNRDGGAELSLDALQMLEDSEGVASWDKWRTIGGHDAASVRVALSDWRFAADLGALSVEFSGPPPIDASSLTAVTPWPEHITGAFGRALPLWPVETSAKQHQE